MCDNQPLTRTRSRTSYCVECHGGFDWELNEDTKVETEGVGSVTHDIKYKCEEARIRVRLRTTSPRTARPASRPNKGHCRGPFTQRIGVAEDPRHLFVCTVSIVRRTAVIVCRTCLRPHCPSGWRDHAPCHWADRRPFLLLGGFSFGRETSGSSTVRQAAGPVAGPHMAWPPRPHF